VQSVEFVPDLEETKLCVHDAYVDFLLI